MIKLFKKKYIQINDAVFRTYKIYKRGDEKKNSTLYVYVLKYDGVLRKFKVMNIKEFKNCIFYEIEFLR